MGIPRDKKKAGHVSARLSIFTNSKNYSALAFAFLACFFAFLAAFLSAFAGAAVSAAGAAAAGAAAAGAAVSAAKEVVVKRTNARIDNTFMIISK